MIFGFLLVFATGFLMTAIPRMGGTPQASRFEISLAAFLALLQILSPFFDPNGSAGPPIALFQFLALTFFIGNRFRSGKIAPPPPFVFLPAALVLGLLGTLLLWLHQISIVSTDAIARVLLYKGFMMCFVLGVGMRLLPVFLHGAPPPSTSSIRYPNWSYLAHASLAFLYFATLIAEGFFPQTANIAQLAVLSFLIFKELQIYKAPRRKGVQAWGVWLSLWSVLIGQAWLSFFPDFALHGAHLIYISGWGLLTFLVATRVVLSHGGGSLQPELSSKTLAAAIGLWTLSGLTRASLLLFQEERFWSHVNYSVLCWLLGISLWIALVAKYLFSKFREEEEKC